MVPVDIDQANCVTGTERLTAQLGYPVDPPVYMPYAVRNGGQFASSGGRRGGCGPDHALSDDFLFA